MDSWLDRLTPGQRAELYDAGRIGNSRFEGPDDPPLYAAHIANPEMKLLVKERFGKVQPFGGDAAVLLLPGSEPRRWFSGEVFIDELPNGTRMQMVALVNEYGDEATARWDAEGRVHGR